MEFNSEGMFRASRRAGEEPQIAIYRLAAPRRRVAARRRRWLRRFSKRPVLMVWYSASITIDAISALFLGAVQGFVGELDQPFERAVGRRAG